MQSHRGEQRESADEKDQHHLIVIGFILWHVGNDLVAIYQQWKTQSDVSKQIRGTRTSTKSELALLDAPDHPDDDVIEPEPVTDEGVSSDLPGERPVTTLKRRYDKIAAKYSAYTQAMAKHANAMGAEPDDAIGPRSLLSRKADDEYEYKQSKVVRNADGSWRDDRQ